MGIPSGAVLVARPVYRGDPEAFATYERIVRDRECPPWDGVNAPALVGAERQAWLDGMKAPDVPEIEFLESFFLPEVEFLERILLDGDPPCPMLPRPLTREEKRAWDRVNLPDAEFDVELQG